jgi:hypothetical protein
MKKHLFSSLGLALMMLVWGGEAKADATYTKVSEVNFESDTDNQIPVGWTIVNNGTTREGGTAYTEWADKATWGANGSRLFVFNSGEKLVYLYNEGSKETSATYNTAVALPAGDIEIRVPSCLWKTGGSCKIGLSVAKSSDTEFASPVYSGEQGLLYAVMAKTNVPNLETAKFRFKNTDAGDYLIKVSAVKLSASTEIVFGGFTAYSYTGTPNTYDDPLTVFEETFAEIPDNYTPGASWTLYTCSEVTTKDTDDSGNETGTSTTTHTKTVVSDGVSKSASGGPRVFRLTGSTNLPAGTYHQAWGYEDNRYAIYNGIDLTADNQYLFSLYASAWNGATDIRVYLLDANENEVYALTQDLTANLAGDKATAITPDHIQFRLTPETTGTYKLKVTSKGQIVFGNISVKQDVATALDETFSGLSHAVPASGSGWYLYDNNGTLITQGKTNISSGPRFFNISGYTGITNVAYLGSNSNCHLTYGEDGSGKTLTLVGGKEYRITYYAANWDGNTKYKRTLKCTIEGKDGEGQAFSREDDLSGICNNNAWNAKYNNTPDFIQATFTPKTSGNYVLTFTGDATVVTNISISDNDEDGVAYVSSLDKFGYTSLYLDQAVSLPDGVTAYIGKLNDAKDAIVLTELEGEVIPANTGVILVGDANAELKFYPTSASATTPTGNILKGVVKGTKASNSDDVYVLGYKSSDEAPAFYKNTTKKIEATTTITIDEDANKATIVTDYKIQEGSTNSTKQTTDTGDWKTTTTVKDSEGNETEKVTTNYNAGTKTDSYEYVQVIRANKAYFVLPASDPATASSIRIQFGEDTDEPGNVTAIERIETEAAPAARVIYDLSGRRLTDMSKPGLYIVNGRKMLVK